MADMDGASLLGDLAEAYDKCTATVGSLAELLSHRLSIQGEKASEVLESTDKQAFLFSKSAKLSTSTANVAAPGCGAAQCQLFRSRSTAEKRQPLTVSRCEVAQVWQARMLLGRADELSAHSSPGAGSSPARSHYGITTLEPLRRHSSDLRGRLHPCRGSHSGNTAAATGVALEEDDPLLLRNPSSVSENRVTASRRLSDIGGNGYGALGGGGKGASPKVSGTGIVSKGISTGVFSTPSPPSEPARRGSGSGFRFARSQSSRMSTAAPWPAAAEAAAEEEEAVEDETDNDPDEDDRGHYGAGTTDAEDGGADTPTTPRTPTAGNGSGAPLVPTPPPSLLLPARRPSGSGLQRALPRSFLSLRPRKSLAGGPSLTASSLTDGERRTSRSSSTSGATAVAASAAGTGAGAARPLPVTPSLLSSAISDVGSAAVAAGLPQRRELQPMPQPLQQQRHQSQQLDDISLPLLPGVLLGAPPSCVASANTAWPTPRRSLQGLPPGGGISRSNSSNRTPTIEWLV